MTPPSPGVLCGREMKIGDTITTHVPMRLMFPNREGLMRVVGVVQAIDDDYGFAYIEPLEINGRSVNSRTNEFMVDVVAVRTEDY